MASTTNFKRPRTGLPHDDCFISLDSTTLEREAAQLVCRFRKEFNESQVVTSRCTDGITNVIVKCVCTPSQGPTQTILVRVYGRKTECLIDRERELSNFILFHEHKLGPPLFGTYTNGYVYGYLDGDACQPLDLKKGNIFPGIAKRLAQMHKIPCPSGSKASVFNTIERWLAEAPKKFDDEHKNAKLQELDLTGAKKMLDALKTHIDELEGIVVMSHNDLLCKNIVFCKETGAVNFIDYEYATYNIRGFDIGNHFNEHAGIDHPVDYTLFPSKEFQCDFIRQYLAEYLGVSASEVTESQINDLYAEANKCALVSHFFWGIWAVIQAANSTIDFDFIEYSSVRLSEFRKRYDEFMAL